MSEEVSLWWRQAGKDFESAQINLESETYYVASLLAQQAVEKALKALYIKKYGKLVKTHDLFFLAKKLNLPDDLADISDSLTEVYVSTRYPDASGDIPANAYTKTEADDDVEKARKVLEWVKKRIY